MNAYTLNGRAGRRQTVWVALALVAGVVAGCAEPPDLSLPTDAQVAEYFSASRVESAEVTGNVAQIVVMQDGDQLRRGGSLWAQVGPYIFLFSAPTQKLFQDFGGLAGVRVVTKVGRAEVARALLPRTALNDLTWRRALNVSGQARRDGTERIPLLEDLIDFGEDHTDFTYNPRYVTGR